MNDTRASRRLSLSEQRILEYLDEADEHLKKGEARIKKQEERVKELASGGQQTKIAEETLKHLRDLLGSMEKHRHLVREEFKKSSDGWDSRVKEKMLSKGSMVKVMNRPHQGPGDTARQWP